MKSQFSLHNFNKKNVGSRASHLEPVDKEFEVDNSLGDQKNESTLGTEH